MANKTETGERINHGHRGAQGKRPRCTTCEHPRRRVVTKNKQSCYCDCHIITSISAP